MRTHPILLLAAGLTLAACDASGGPLTGDPSTDGTLVVSTASAGNDPDRDGYLLTVDGTDSLPLDPTGTSQLDLPAGMHLLRLLGMEEHCSVSPGTPLDVEVPSRGTTAVAFEVTCSVSGVRVTNTTTGLDLDPDGYRIEVDGDPGGSVPANGAELIRLDPGTRTIGLGDLAPNCTTEDPGSRTVTIVEGELAQAEFAIVCTATTGRIGVIVETSGVSAGSAYQALLDGTSFLVDARGTTYLPAPAGDHVVLLVAPANCSVDTESRPVTVTAGGLVRDTAYVGFALTCTQQLGKIRITAPTTGRVPAGHRYEVLVCANEGFTCPWSPLLRRRLAPNDTVIASYGTIEVSVELKDIPATCRVDTANPTPFFPVPANTLRDVRFPVVCPP